MRMRIRWHHSVLLLTSIAAAPSQLWAQQAATHEPQTVLFVCEHGTVKSLLAKVLFEEYAQQVGLEMRAESRGTKVDSVVPPWMLRGLAMDHVTLGGWRPQGLRESDVMAASYVVSFDVPQSATVGAR